MKFTAIFTTGALAMSFGLIGCGAPAVNTTVNVKPANANTTVPTNAANAPANTAAAPAQSNTSTNSSATGTGAQDFTLVNKTGVVIDQVYVSAHNVDDWEEDILGQDQLADNGKVDITFKRSEKAPMWDLKVVDTKGNAIEWENLNLMEISKVTLHYENGKATAETE